ncbi:DEAD/DEAH box helicase [Caldilinea sp.]|uniref:DEAD/DEAH box helicase n=1 Tax=Caldilinea sp. TaxID=2293560 RepID=UPI002C63FE24|nr:DEAD/DEAH box helicase [Caldilinea sp.]
MTALALKSRLPRTWSPFFARHGTFTPAQLAAIPPLLDGQNVMLCAPTASGKTEAALAPFIERHLPPARTTQQLTLLYLLPTRALIADIANRLAAPLERLRVSLAVKTHDLDDFDPRRPADLLLTTPESLDALLATKARSLMHVRGVVLDELHVLDGDARGDQLRAVLARLRQVVTFAAQQGDDAAGHIQYVALSATLADPATVAARYFPNPQVVITPGGRDRRIELLPMAPDSAAALLEHLATFQGSDWRKALVFCNTRAEVEAYAMAVRGAHTPFGYAVYVHYSNLERRRRQEIEQQFAQAGAAICFASSTLELGIDIGSIDVAILIGAPGSAAAFTQRIGRAGRRQRTIHATCFFRTPLEEMLLRALMDAAGPTLTSAPFRPSVAVQQIFSLLLQSPTGALRLQPLIDLFSGLLAAADLEALLGRLHELRYLTTARAGEWRAGERLKRLVDQQASDHAPLSLYSNIQNRPATLKIRDQNSQQVVATVDPLWLDRAVLTLEGRALDVTWFDGEALWVTHGSAQGEQAKLPFLSARQLLSFDLAQALPRVLGLAPEGAPLVETPTGWLLFHWLGDVYGQALLDLLRPQIAVSAASQPGLALLLSDAPRNLPAISSEQTIRYLHEHVRQYEGLLALGAYNYLLPYALRQRAVVEQFDVARFVEATQRLKLLRADTTVSEELLRLT